MNLLRSWIASKYAWYFYSMYNNWASFFILPYRGLSHNTLLQLLTVAPKEKMAVSHDAEYAWMFKKKTETVYHRAHDLLLPSQTLRRPSSWRPTAWRTRGPRAATVRPATTRDSARGSPTPRRSSAHATTDMRETFARRRPRTYAMLSSYPIITIQFLLCKKYIQIFSSSSVFQGLNGLLMPLALL